MAAAAIREAEARSGRHPRPPARAHARHLAWTRQETMPGGLITRAPPSGKRRPQSRDRAAVFAMAPPTAGQRGGGCIRGQPGRWREAPPRVPRHSWGKILIWVERRAQLRTDSQARTVHTRRPRRHIRALRVLVRRTCLGVTWATYMGWRPPAWDYALRTCMKRNSTTISVTQSRPWARRRPRRREMRPPGREHETRGVGSSYRSCKRFWGHRRRYARSSLT